MSHQMLHPKGKREFDRTTFVRVRVRDHLHARSTEILRKIRKAEENKNDVLVEQLVAEWRALQVEWAINEDAADTIRA